MKVTVKTTTAQPLDVISMAAGCCFGKRDTNPRRAMTCYKAKHLSVFEHASATFEVEGISRACMAQLTRHRLCSFCIESQRYCKYSLHDDEWFVIPPSFENDKAYFKKCMRDYASHYNVCVAGGMKPEDARYLLPEAMKTRLIMTCNVRQLFHLLDMRADSAAQWEIRSLAFGLVEALKDEGEQWLDLMMLWEGGSDEE